MLENQPITVLIVDDEKEIRRGLCRLFDWEAMGFSVIGTARNGRQGLEMMRYHWPDIVVTDITMPEMSGLDMIKAAKEEGLTSRFVVLSGYDDFQYAKTAIRYGVEDYILKPVSVEELKKILKSLKSHIIGQRNQRHSNRIMSQSLHRANRIVSQQQMVSSFLRGENLPGGTEKTPLPLRDAACLAVVFYFYRKDTLYETEDGIERRTEPVLEFLHGAFSSVRAIIGGDVRSSIIVLMNAESEQQTCDKIQEVVHRLNRACGVRVFAAVGSLASSLRGLRQSYQDAVMVSSWHIYPQLGSVGNVSLNKAPFQYFAIDPHPVVHAVRNGNVELVREEFEKYCKMLRSKADLPQPAFVLSMCHYLIVTVRTSVPMPLESFVGDAYQTMRQLDTFVDIHDWMVHVLTDFANEVSMQRAEKQDLLIEKAVKYIKDHICEKVYAEDVCQYVGYSKTYFSKYFKEKTNLNFRDYILDLKIKYAQQQLAEKRATPSELALKLGYEEYSSFSRVFKARTGFSPLDYQKSNEGTS